MDRITVFSKTLFIIFFVSSANLWGMHHDDAATLKESLTGLAGNLKGLKTKNEILATKLVLLKDRLEGKEPDKHVPDPKPDIPVAADAAAQKKLNLELENHLTIKPDMQCKVGSEVMQQFGKAYEDAVGNKCPSDRISLYLSGGSECDDSRKWMEVIIFTKILKSLDESTFDQNSLNTAVKGFYKKNTKFIMSSLVKALNYICDPKYPETLKKIVSKKELLIYNPNFSDAILVTLNHLKILLLKYITAVIDKKAFDGTPLSAELVALKSKIEGNVEDVPPVDELPVPPVAEVILGGAIKDGLVQGAIDPSTLTGKVKEFQTKLYSLNKTQQDDGGNADKLYAFTDHNSYGVLTDFSKDDTLINDQDSYFAALIAGFKDWATEDLHSINMLCKDYIKTLENIYGPFEKISTVGTISITVNAIETSTEDQIIASMQALVTDGYVSSKNTAITESDDQAAKNNLQGSADYIAKVLLSGKVSDNKVLEKLLPSLKWRTEGLVTAYALLANGYPEQTFLHWSTGAILWYVGQLHEGSGSHVQIKKYKYLSTRCLINLINVMTKITGDFDKKVEGIRQACDEYIDSNKNPKVEVVGTTANPYKDPLKGFTFEGRTIKRQLLSLIFALRCMNKIDEEIKQRPKDVVTVANPIVNKILEKTPDSLLTTPINKMNAIKYGSFLKQIYMQSCDALTEGKDIGALKGYDVFYVLNGILSDFNEAMKQVKDKGDAAIKTEFNAWKKPFAYCDGIIKNIFKSKETLESFVQQTKDTKKITKFIEVVGSILRYEQTVFDFDAANKELDPKYKMQPPSGFKCDDKAAVKDSNIYKHIDATKNEYNLISITVVLVGAINDLELFKKGLDIILSDEIKMTFKFTLVDLCREALKENLQNDRYAKYFEAAAAVEFVIAVKNKIAEKGKKSGACQPFIDELKTILKIK